MKLHFLAILSILILSACDKPNPQPELLDPIYATIEAELKEAQKAASEAAKEEATAKLELQKIEPQTGEHRTKWRAYFEARKKTQAAEQHAHYYELKLFERKKTARFDYLEAFKKKEPWPDPSEFAQYKKDKGRKMAPRSWAHVLKQRLPAQHIAPKPAQTSASAH
jgi:hypothetical protein